jgi:valyl-tRNA synthetase
VDERYLNDSAESQMNLLMDMVRGIRESRTQYKVDPGKRIKAIIAPASQRSNLEQYDYVFARLCNVEQVTLLTDDAAAPANSASSVVGDTTIYLPLEGMLDIAKECERLTKEQAETADLIQKALAKLENESFVSKAPAQVVQRERDRLAELQAAAQNIEELLRNLCQ